MLQNSNTRCNGLLPIWGPEVDDSLLHHSLVQPPSYTILPSTHLVIHFPAHSITRPPTLSSPVHPLGRSQIRPSPAAWLVTTVMSERPLDTMMPLILPGYTTLSCSFSSLPTSSPSARTAEEEVHRATSTSFPTSFM